MSFKDSHNHNLLSALRSRGFSNTFKIVLIFCVLVLILLSYLLYWSRGYSGKLSPNTIIAGLDVGGMDPYSANLVIQDKIDYIFTNGTTIDVQGMQKQIPLSTLISGDLIEYVQFGVDSTIEKAILINHDTNPFVDIYLLLISLQKKTNLNLDIKLSDNSIKESIYSLFSDVEQLAIEPEFIFSNTYSGWSVGIDDGRPGQEFMFDAYFTELKQQLDKLKLSPIKLVLSYQEPKLSNSKASTYGEDALVIINAGPITFVYTPDEVKKQTTWTMSQLEISKLITPNESGTHIGKEKFNEFLDEIAENLEVKFKDAKLEIENNRVVDFTKSSNGLSVNRDEIYDSFINYPFYEPAGDIDVFTTIIEPEIEIKDINDLGITEVLGVGTSSYAGSPKNRRINIQNGVNLLNGLLIPPGDTFSLVNALKPFTFENGYLPELVIKGEKIKPEIGGGLCQIGTTTFRTTMNAGLEIIERQNHSLVVSYYNDQRNGNPGTDATIYEPAPDYKFRNDTENYVLFQAENFTNRNSLQFTFWGTSDGRKASYNQPTVTRWIPVGETIYRETTDLEPGEEKCQAKHIGANAYFDYTIERENTEPETTRFTSHYRPLPEICLVGVEELSSEDNNTEDNLEKNTNKKVEN